MKYRKTFVSNSSTSSYVCCVCGNEEVGYDGNYDDIPLYCVNWHTFHTSCLPFDDSDNDDAKLREVCIWMLEDALNDTDIDPEFEAELDGLLQFVYKDPEGADFVTLYKEHSGGYERLPEIVCPICSFNQYHEYQLLKYMLKEKYPTKKIGDAISMALRNLKHQFRTYKEFLKYIDEDIPE